MPLCFFFFEIFIFMNNFVSYTPPQTTGWFFFIFHYNWTSDFANHMTGFNCHHSSLSPSVSLYLTLFACPTTDLILGSVVFSLDFLFSLIAWWQPRSHTEHTQPEESLWNASRFTSSPTVVQRASLHSGLSVKVSVGPPHPSLSVKVSPLLCVTLCLTLTQVKDGQTQPKAGDSLVLILWCFSLPLTSQCQKHCPVVLEHVYTLALWSWSTCVYCGPVVLEHVCVLLLCGTGARVCTISVTLHYDYVRVFLLAKGQKHRGGEGSKFLFVFSHLEQWLIPGCQYWIWTNDRLYKI